MLVSNTPRPGSFRNSTHGQFSCFNTKIAYLKIFDITRDSAKEYSSIFQKMQHKDNKAIAIHSWIARKIWFSFQVSLCFPSLGWFIEARLYLLLWSLFCWFLSSHIPVLGWVTCTLLPWSSSYPRMTPTPFWLAYEGHLHNSLIHSTFRAIG